MRLRHTTERSSLGGGVAPSSSAAGCELPRMGPAGEDAGATYFHGRDAKKILEPLSSEYATVPLQRTAPKVGRNESCPCDSGKKFKRCCGAA